MSSIMCRSEIRLWAVLFWLAVWQVVSMWLDSAILLVSPVNVLCRLGQLIWTVPFWKAVLFSVSRITSGFLLAVLTGGLLAAAAARCQRILELLAPVMLAVRSVPVASFIILALIWFSSRNLSILIAFMMVLPVIYTNVLGGIRTVDGQLLEMAHIFRVSKLRVARYIYLPQIMPFFNSACSVSLGLAWKAGVAAEVIGIPRGSVGERLQQAKVYLDTPDLFAWTLVIVVLSLVFEKVVLYFLKNRVPLLWSSCGQRAGQRIPKCMQNGVRGKSPRDKIIVNNLSKSFDGTDVFTHLNLAVDSGTAMCIMGSSGAGKTTLLRILMGLEQADDGSVTGLEQQRFSAVFQEERLCGYMSAQDNIRLAAPALGSQAIQRELSRLGMADCGAQPVSAFSGGMRRRVSILRALAADYDVLFLDEPFQGLDAALKEQVIAYVREKTAGKTVFIVTHDREEALALGAEVAALF